MAAYQRRTGLKPCGQHRPLADRLNKEGLKPDEVRARVLAKFPEAAATQIIDPSGLIFFDLQEGVVVDVTR